MTTDQTLATSFELSQLPAAFYENPYPTYAALRDHDPVRTLDNGSVFVTRYADVVELYRNPAASSDKKVEFKPKFGDTPLYEHHTTSLVFNDPPLHTRVRRIIMGAVNQRAVTRMEQGIVDLVDGLIDALAAKAANTGSVDLIDDFAAAIPVEVIGNLLGVPRAERAPLRGWSLAILAALEPTLTPAMHDQGNRAVTEFTAYLKGLIAERTAHPLNPDEDVLTRLIQGERSGPAVATSAGEKLTEAELLQNCIFMLNAGHETTSNTIGNGLYALMHRPEEAQRLRDDPLLINTAVEEILRFDSPLQFNNRRLIADTTIAGQPYPAGTLVTMCIGSANRDERQFPDPTRFDVARKPNLHLAFGHSAHACVGMNVARLEVRIAVGRLLARFKTLEPTEAPDRDLRARFRGFRHLPARLA